MLVLPCEKRSNEGLVTAEIELSDPDQHFERPPWLGKEVSGDPRYLNTSLSRDPYSRWKQPVSDDADLTQLPHLSGG